MPKNSNIWLCIEALAAGLGCDHQAAEDVLADLEADLKQLDEASRATMREKLISIVGQLSRLEVRMMADDGPRSLAK
jgi:predicted ABC-type transport system involved in lysophospholipase L1 biosynthesis ATPase subunit